MMLERAPDSSIPAGVVALNVGGQFFRNLESNAYQSAPFLQQPRQLST